MPKAIIVKYLPPSATKPARLSARDMDRHRLTRSRRYQLDATADSRNLAASFAAKYYGYPANPMPWFASGKISRNEDVYILIDRED